MIPFFIHSHFFLFSHQWQHIYTDNFLRVKTAAVFFLILSIFISKMNKICADVDWNLQKQIRAESHLRNISTLTSRATCIRFVFVQIKYIFFRQKLLFMPNNSWWGQKTWSCVTSCRWITTNSLTASWSLQFVFACVWEWERACGFVITGFHSKAEFTFNQWLNNSKVV